ncbi:hypothetical protein ABPG74_011032 [Tetrahymena malaccensis]
MGQTVARDLGLQQSEEEFEKNEKIKRIIDEMMRKKQSTNQSQSIQRSKFMSENVEEDDEDEELEDDDDEDDEDDFSIDDSNYQHQKKGVISSDSSMRQDSNQISQNNTKANPNSQYQRPFQSIKINNLYGNTNEDEEDEDHEQEMLKDMSDDDEIEANYNEPKNLSKQNSQEKYKKNIHNINKDDHAINQNNRNTETQIKFQSVFNKDFDFTIQSESEQSQFGAVFSSDSEPEEQSIPSDKIRSGLLEFPDKDKLKVEEDDGKLKSPGVLTKERSSRRTSQKSKNMQSSKGKQSQSNHFFPSQRNTKHDSAKKDYEKYLTEFFPDRKSQRVDM